MTAIQGADAANVGTTITVAFSTGVVRGDLLVYTVCSDKLQLSTSGADETPVLAVQRTNLTTNIDTIIYYIKNCRGGVTQAFTRTTSVSANTSLTCEEYAGADLGSPLDVVADNAGNTTAATVTSPTTTQANELVVSMVGSRNLVTDFTEGAGFFARWDTAVDFASSRPILHEDRTVTATGAQTVTGTLDTADEWHCMVATFKEAPHLTVTFEGVGVSGVVASGNMTPRNPQALKVNDLLVCLLSQHDNVVATMPAGWTRIIAANNTVNCRLDTWWKRVASPSEAGATVTVTRAAGDAGLAQIAAFRNVLSGLLSTLPYEASGTANNVGPTTTCTCPSVTPLSTDRMCVFVGVIDDDGAFTAFSGTDPVPVERYDELTTLGLDASLCLDTGIRAAATATGARTSTNGRSLDTIGATILLIPSTNPELPPAVPLKTRPFPYKPGSPR